MLVYNRLKSILFLFSCTIFPLHGWLIGEPVQGPISFLATATLYPKTRLLHENTYIIFLSLVSLVNFSALNARIKVPLTFLL